ncbi:MAG: glycerol acyltransferase [Betaproteobacteria bacterium RIFCSPLOWO2_02_67_12]|nr:MAG: glycerol acyltransferase [Betaproteobacteria bacterium RIFCSPLOWO2_02_67_12]OGA29887.1 MAG: glycerol acyltransferase [Betaproteobacteria bacterium RIFCSPLOWO2_02_FULL_68_150]OGA70852.1 MAG: glycerol acyltransferase [Betaproteobacteria bacterium RIFCSPLOWO2_12_FULL_67_28]
MAEHSQFRLLAERRFGPFFGVQFLGAMNDNVFKQALVILLAYQTASFTTLASDTLQNLAQALFVLPFFLFSATAGQIADKYEKSGLITVTVAIELACMALGAVGLLTQNLALLLAALFLGGMQSTLFGPVKYAILPQQLKDTEIVGGNGLVEMGTSIAILAGMVYGGWMVTQAGWGVAGVAASAMAFSAAGIALSRLIPKAPAADPALRINWNPITETWRNLRFARRNRTVFLSILGISWFWFYGSMLVTQFPNLSKNILQADEHVVTLLLVVFSIGIGVGSLLCERLSGHKVEIGLVPFGSIGLTVFGIDLWLAGAGHLAHGPVALGEFVRDPGHWRLLADLLLIGLFGGFYIVPLYALVQTRSEPSHRSRVIAGNNILNAVFMVGAAALAIGLFQAGLTIPQLILVTALLNAAVAIYIYTLVPEFLMRFIVWMLIHSVYRLKKTGLENVPEEGPAVIVCNHVSLVDALVIAAACRRPIRFVMDHQIFRLPILSFVFRTGKAIPIASAKQDPQMMERAFDEVSRALRAGDLVAIFPEGRLSDTGELAPFRAGIARILERDPVPVVPMALQGLWGSFFSRKGGAAMTKPWRLRPFASIGLAVGAPLAAAPPEALQARVRALREDWR